MRYIYFSSTFKVDTNFIRWLYNSLCSYIYFVNICTCFLSVSLCKTRLGLMKTTACVQLTPAVLIFASFFFFARGCCNCLLATSRQRHKNAEKFVACCVRAAQLAKLATCFTACNEFMHRRLPPFLTCSTLNRISFNCTFFKCLVNVFFFLFPCFVFF